MDFSIKKTDNIINLKKTSLVSKSQNNRINFTSQEEKLDTVEINSEISTRTDLEKKNLVKDYRAKAAGWSAFFGGFSTLYYLLRSKKTVAENYNLDIKKDKKLIDQIHSEQWKYTLPSLIIGLSLLSGGITYAVCKAKVPESIVLDE